MMNRFQDIYNLLKQHKDNAKYDKVEILANELLQLANQKKDAYAQGMGYYYLAEVKYHHQDYVECIQLCWNMQFVCERESYPRLYALSCNLAGKAYGSQGDYHSAISLFLQGYYIAKEHDFLDIESIILNNIGTLFFNLEHYDEAIRYFERALFIIKNNDAPLEVSHEIIMLNIISAHLRLKNFNEVEQLTKQFEETFPNIENHIVQSGMIMEKILKAYEYKKLDIFKECVIELINVSKANWTGNYAIQIILETAEFCLELREFSLLQICLNCLKEKLAKGDYRQRIYLSFLFIEMYRLLEDHQQLFLELEDYFNLTRQYYIQDKTVEFNGLKNKIILEREIFAKKKLIEKNKELSAKSEKDLFTGLLNKTSFVDHVNKRLKNSMKKGYCTMFIIDVDDFKYINDTYGHLVGDEVLKLLANSFVNTFRLDDIIGRIGGDEFCIFVDGMKDIRIIEEKTEALRKEIQNLYIPGCTTCKVTASIGVCITNQKISYQEIFMKADNALYKAKNKGKNNFYIDKIIK